VCASLMDGCQPVVTYSPDYDLLYGSELVGSWLLHYSVNAFRSLDGV